MGGRTVTSASRENISRVGTRGQIERTVAMRREDNESASICELAPFERGLAIVWDPREWCDTHTVVAVSGGADSVALLRAMATLKTKYVGSGALVVAHLDHQLRDEAQADSAWLANLCCGLGVTLEVGSTDVASRSVSYGDGLEAAARDARYEFLVRTAERLGARYVAMAHTADDQTETVLHRILRGTGLTGLAGIPSRRRLSESVTLVRPILLATRAEVLSYLATLGQDYRSDLSNEDERFTRNRVRHQLLPQLRSSFNPEVDAALRRLASQASETQQAIELLAEKLAADCVIASPDRPQQENGEVQIDCLTLCEQPDVLIREVCKLAWRQAGWSMQAMGFVEWGLLAAMVAGQRQHANLPGNVRALRQSDRLVLERRSLS